MNLNAGAGSQIGALEFVQGDYCVHGESWPVSACVSLFACAPSIPLFGYDAQLLLDAYAASGSAARARANAQAVRLRAGELGFLMHMRLCGMHLHVCCALCRARLC